MFIPLRKAQGEVAARILSGFIAFSFLFTSVLPLSYAQLIPEILLPPPGTLMTMSVGYTPTLIKGLTIHPEDPLKFDFIVDTGDSKIAGDQLKTESTKLIKYFLASLTVPEKEMWVNLSPYEKDRIIPEDFGVTEMGRDLLGQDYILKQLTASLVYPENGLGKEFWTKLRSKAQAQFGTSDIPLNTFNKVWIVPDKAVVYEHDQSAFVVESHLKVMLEEDYLASQKKMENAEAGASDMKMDDAKAFSKVSSQVVRDLLIPEIEKEVNSGKNFANLRQVYNSMILAVWYKKNLRESLLGQVYVDKNKVEGVDVNDRNAKQKIYEQYLEAFKKGTFNYLKQENDPATQDVVYRKYFSGGVVGVHDVTTIQDEAMLTPQQRGQIPSASSSFVNEVDLKGVRKVGGAVERVMLSTKDREEIASIQAQLFNDPRFRNVKRNYTAATIWRNRGNVIPVPIIQNTLSRKLYFSMQGKEDNRLNGNKNNFIITGGVTKGEEAEVMAQAGAVATYGSGWQASKEEGEPDLANYALTKMAELITRVNKLLIKKNIDQKGRFETMMRALDKPFADMFTENWQALDNQAKERRKKELVASMMSVVQADMTIFLGGRERLSQIENLFTQVVANSSQMGALLLDEEYKQNTIDFTKLSLTKMLVDYLIPMFADGDTGHESLNELVRTFVTAMAALIHLEDQKHGCKKCGHLPGKVIVSMAEHDLRLTQTRWFLDLMGSEMMITARTDAHDAKLLSSNQDVRDQYFIKGTLNKDIPTLSAVTRISRDEAHEYLTKEEALKKEVVGKKWGSPEKEKEIIATIKTIWDARSKDDIDTVTENTKKLILLWSDAAKIITYTDAVSAAILAGQGRIAGRGVADMSITYMGKQGREKLVKEWENLTDPLRLVDNGKGEMVPNFNSLKQLKQMAKYHYSISFYWDEEAPRVYEGFYQVKSGDVYAAVRGREFGQKADSVWEELNKPDRDESGFFAKAMKSYDKSKHAFLALNLSPSFNWNVPSHWKAYLGAEAVARLEKGISEGLDLNNPETWKGYEDDVLKMEDAIRNFNQEMGDQGYVFQFITVFSQHVSMLATYRATKSLLYKGGVYSFVKDNQRYELQLEAEGYDFGEHQGSAGAKRVAQLLDDGVFQGVSATSPVSKEGTATQFSGKKASSSGDINKVGGIDLNPNEINMQVKHDGNKVIMPINNSPIMNFNIDGFIPVIINVTPVTNLPLLLGFTPDDKQKDLGYDQSAPKAREPEKISFLN